MSTGREYEVTAQLTRTARFRVTADSRQDAEARVTRFENGVRSMQDLEDTCELEVDHIISTEVVTG